MQRIFWMLCLFVTWGQSAGTQLTVLSDRASIRQAPNAQSPTVSTAARGAILNGLERRDNWWRIALTDGQTGWVFSAIVADSASSAGISRGAPAANEYSTLVGEYWLLSIGVDRYTYWPPLENAVHDAKAVVEVLTRDYGFKSNRVITLYDKQATEDNIINTFIELQSKLGPNDSLLIYYAGHGIVDAFKTGSWIPVDSREGQIADYISTDRLTRMIGTLPAKHVFLVADACFSGSLLDARSARKDDAMSDRYFRENVRRASRQALTSGGMEEVADGGAEGHSIFAHHFLRELRQNETPYLAASALSASVERLVARNATQEPRWSHLREAGDEDGEFFFLRSSVAAPDAGSQAKAASQLTVSSEPDGATVAIDGEPVGSTPLSVGGLAGRVVVTVTKEGFDAAGENVVIRMDRTQNLSFNLTPADGAGQLSITSTPEDAAWYVDGYFMGRTPDQVASLAGGMHRIRVVKPGFAPWEQTVEVATGRPLRLRAEMRREEAVVRTEPVPPKASAPAPLPTALAGTRAEAEDFREVETRLREFVTAYLNRDLARIDQVARVSARNRNLLQHLFTNYKTVVVRVTNHSVSGANARAVVQIERLVRNNGDEVQPSAGWRQANVTLAKANGEWGKIEW